MTAWMPIDSAPKDGTEVLVWDGAIRGVLIAEHAHGAWIVCDGEGWERISPTHWQPLPPPPGDGDKGGSNSVIAATEKALRGLMDAVHAVRNASSPEEALDAMHDCVEPALSYAEEVLK